MAYVLACLTPALLAPASLTAADTGSVVTPGYSEYEIKSAMLYNFAKFIGWPAGTLGEGGTPLVVGILGNDAFASLLDADLRDKIVSGHPVVVRRLESGDGLKNCHVLFVGASERRQVTAILRSLSNAPVLTIGDGVQFACRGGIVAFIRDGRRIRFEINLDAAAQAHLKVSSKLLRLTEVRRDVPRRPGN